MARQKGVIKYVGTLGDIRHFKIKGQEGYFAGMVGGPTGDAVELAAEKFRLGLFPEEKLDRPVGQPAKILGDPEPDAVAGQQFDDAKPVQRREVANAFGFRYVVVLHAVGDRPVPRAGPR